MGNGTSTIKAKSVICLSTFQCGLAMASLNGLAQVRVGLGLRVGVLMFCIKLFQVTWRRCFVEACFSGWCSCCEGCAVIWLLLRG